MGALASVNGLESTCRSRSVAELVSTWVKIRRGWRHSVLSFFCFLLWHRKDPRGRNGLSDLPRFHHCFPKHPWNVSSWKPPFHPESPAPRTPRSPRTWRVSLLKGKQKKKEKAYRRIVVQLWGYSYSARTQRATEWPPTAQGSIQKRPSTLLGFWHAKCSHCLVDDMVR